jgi:two-component system, cell cycle sensor histidine kinase and response regulator CckA
MSEKPTYEELERRIKVLEESAIESRRLQTALMESEEKFRVLTDSTPTAVMLYQDDRWIYANRATETITGYSAKELLIMNFWDIVHPDYKALIQERGRKRQQGEEAKNRYEFKIITKDGKEKWVDLSGASTMIGGRPAGVISVADITERKEVEKELNVIRNRLSRAEIISCSGNWEFDMKSNLVLASEGARRIYGLLDSEWTIQEVQKIPLPEYRYILDKAIRDLIEENRPYDVEFKIKRPDTDEIIDIHSVAEYDPHRKVVFGIIRDITARKRAEEELHESRRRLSDIIEFLPDATLVIDQEGKIIAWNRAIETMTGIKKEDMIGKGNYEYALPFYGDRRPMLIDLALHSDREIEKKYTAIKRVGDILFGESFTPNLPPGDVHLYATASVLRDSQDKIIAAIECIRDNTERKRLEERLNRAEKMEALGTLAGGVAHDLNNVLGVLVGYSELLREKLPDDSTLKRYADSILKSSMRGAAIIQDLLTLARRGVTVSEVVDLNRLVFDYLRTPEFEKMKSYHPDVKIWTELEDGLLNIKGSPIHLGKTIMNLVSNAAEAISGFGEVTIRTKNCYLDKPIKGYEEMKKGDYVVLTVSDTGSGISANDRDKIFEPFYTKKVMGRSGTGLGLAVVWGTVRDHYGYIDVQSEEGKGSTFALYFPVTGDEIGKVERAISPLSYMGKGESILVVDDMKEQRELAMSMLGKLGYQVDAVGSGEEAIEYLKDKKVDLLVLDMIMDPGIDGMETYRRILETNPGQKAVIVSGFSETDRVRDALKMGAGAFVRKPYILENIGLAVRKELEQK